MVDDESGPAGGTNASPFSRSCSTRVTNVRGWGRVAAETERLFDSGKVREPRAPAASSRRPSSDPPASGIHRPPSTSARAVRSTRAHWLYGRGAKSVCVLDFASDTTAGGDWRGNRVGTQEESLCRNSSLGRALEALPYPLPALGVAYVPDVAVLRVGAPRTLLSATLPRRRRCSRARDVGGDDPNKKQRAFLAAKVEARALNNGPTRTRRHRPRLVGMWCLQEPARPGG